MARKMLGVKLSRGQISGFSIGAGAFEVVAEKAGGVVKVEQGQEGRGQVDLAGHAVVVARGDVLG